MKGKRLLSTLTKLFSKDDRYKLAKELKISEDRILLTVPELRFWRNTISSKSVGLIPTMGALHEGHMSLLKKSKAENDITVGTIFINPAQFAPHEDFTKYPWTPVSDIKQMIQQGAEKVFIPSVQEMYPNSKPGQTFHSVTSTLVVPVGLDNLSEGSSRPGFFTGVSTVVAKLFNLVQPHKAYFGQKDGLQVMTIRRMVRDLNIPVTIVPCDTIRESDGLAKSSRNIYLSETQRKIAPILYKSLLKVKHSYAKGERNYDHLCKIGRDELKHDSFKIDYFSICDALSGVEFEAGKELSESDIMVSSAIHFGNCRLIDNILMGKQT